MNPINTLTFISSKARFSAIYAYASKMVAFTRIILGHIFVLISSEKYSYAILYESFVSSTNKMENNCIILQTTVNLHNKLHHHTNIMKVEFPFQSGENN